MPGRLIFFIFILALILFFIGFNLGEDNRCDINLVFTVLPKVPVFFTIFVSFALGLLCSLPFAIKSRLRRKRDETVKDKKQGKKPAKDNFSGSENGHYSIDPGTDEKIKQDAASARKRFFAKRPGNKQ